MNKEVNHFYYEIATLPSVARNDIESCIIYDIESSNITTIPNISAQS